MHRHYLLAHRESTLAFLVKYFFLMVDLSVFLVTKSVFPSQIIYRNYGKCEQVEFTVANKTESIFGFGKASNRCFPNNHKSVMCLENGDDG